MGIRRGRDAPLVVMLMWEVVGCPWSRTWSPAIDLVLSECDLIEVSLLNAKVESLLCLARWLVRNRDRHGYD